MPCLPQPFANCYILLFFPLWRGWRWGGGGEKRRLAGRLLCFSSTCRFIILTVSGSLCHLTISVTSHRRAELLSSLWCSDSDPIVCSLIDTFTRADWPFVFQRGGTVRSAAGAVQGGDGDKEGWRRRRLYGREDKERRQMQKM